MLFASGGLSKQSTKFIRIQQAKYANSDQRFPAFNFNPCSVYGFFPALKERFPAPQQKIAFNMGSDHYFWKVMLSRTGFEPVTR